MVYSHVESFNYFIKQGLSNIVSLADKVDVNGVNMELLDLSISAP